MILIENDELILMEGNFLSIGYSKDKQVIGFCLLNKYCWINIFGFEILESE